MNYKNMLSEDDYEELCKESTKLKIAVCMIRENLDTPSIARGCVAAEDLEDLLTTSKRSDIDETTIAEINDMLNTISDAAIGAEVAAEEIIDPAKKARKHQHEAKKLIIE